MNNEKFQFRLISLLLVLVWFYSFFESVIAPPFLGFYTFDESFITDSGVFLWYGKTPRILDWPASPSVLLYALIFGVDMFINLCKNIGSISGVVDVFHLIDQSAYNYLSDREPYILVGRTIQLLLVGFFLYSTIRFIYKQNHPWLDAISKPVVAIIIIGSHLFWNNGVVLRPEAISGSIFIYIICRLIFTQTLKQDQIVTLSILYGVVIAERLIFLFFAPFFFLSILLLIDKNKWTSTFKSLLYFLIAFTAFCPFILTDPLILLKSFLGGIFAKVNDAPMATLFNWDFIQTYFESPVGYIMTPLTILGVLACLTSKSWTHRILVINWIMFILSVLRSAKIYDPHVLPGALIGIVLGGIGLSYLFKKINKPTSWAIATALLITIGEAVITVKYHRWVHETHNVHEAYRWLLQQPQTGKLLIPMDLGIYLPKDEATLRREYEANASFDNKVKKLNYLMGLGGKENNQADAANFPISTSAFAFEDEELFDVQYQILLKHVKQTNPSFDYDIFLDDNTLVYHAITPTEGTERFNNGDYQYWVSDVALENKVPVQSFTKDSGPAIHIYEYIKE